MRNLGTNSCLDTLAQNNQGGVPGLYPCHKMGTNQVMFEIFLKQKKEGIVKGSSFE